jgi:hypothetical protein
MKVIHKYQLPVAETVVLAMPQFCQVVRIDSLDGFMWLWALVDTDEPVVGYRFNAYKTGGKIPDEVVQFYVGCAAIFIQMELMLYWFQERDPAPLDDKPVIPKKTLAEFFGYLPGGSPALDPSKNGGITA